MYLELAKARKDLPVRVLGNFHRLKKKNGAIVHFYNLGIPLLKQKDALRSTKYLQSSG